MPKLNRIHLTNQINDTLTDYCRAGCPHLDSRQSDRVCMTCPVGVILQGYGKQLITDEIPVASKTEWTPELDAKLIELLKLSKYGEMDDVAKKMGLPKSVCYRRRARLAKKGLI